MSSLGLRTVDTFGPRLPFLMKLLAAAEPLSLQVHPTSERARIRYAEQNAAGIALDAPERSYQDASHKPELIFALTRFEGMAGFRDTAKTAAILRQLGLPWLDEIADQLEDTPTPFQTLRRVVTALLAMSGPELHARLQELRDGGRGRRGALAPPAAAAATGARRAEQPGAREPAGVRPDRHRWWTATPTTPACW